MDIIKVFGTNVKRYRQQTGFSQEAFAEKCGMHRTYISAIECFRRSISLENIQRIAEALNIEAYKLPLENKEGNHRNIGRDTLQHILMVFAKGFSVSNYCFRSIAEAQIVVFIARLEQI